MCGLVYKITKDILPGPEPRLNPSPLLHKIIPVSEPLLIGNEKKYLLDCLKTNWISSAGSYVPKFERAFSRYCRVKYGIACSSGTAALHLALVACGITKGDEVIIPTFTMISTANAVTYTGAKVILVDVEPRTYNIDVDKIEEKITSRTKAIIIVHIYGHPADMDKILDIAKKYKLYVIEDAAEAHGAEYKGKKVGGIGDVGCFSFYGNKIITTGEGGMVITNNKKIAERAAYLRDHTFSKERHFWHKELGFNYRMTNLQAAVGVAQVEKIKELIKMKINIAKYYNSLLKGIAGITLPPNTRGIKNVYWLYSILIERDFAISRDRFRQSLAGQGIETRAFFIPIHLQPIYYKKHNRDKFFVAEELCRKGVCLPSGLTLKKSDIKYIVDTMLKLSQRC